MLLVIERGFPTETGASYNSPAEDDIALAIAAGWSREEFSPLNVALRSGPTFACSAKSPGTIDQHSFKGKCTSWSAAA